MEARPETFGAERWAALLTAELGVPTRVTFGRARRDVLVVRADPGPARSRGGLHVRMNAMFAGAPPEVRGSVVRWLRSGRRAPKAARTLDAWIAEALAETPPPPSRTPPRTAGDHHDLAEIAADLRRSEPAALAETLERWPTLGWGNVRRTGARRSIHLGTYDADHHRVRVHRVLDQEAVPRFMVRFVVFHELLHAALPPRRGEDGRMVYHGPEFRRRERSFPDFRRARAWEDEHIGRLLHSTRTGEDLRPHCRPSRPSRAGGAKPSTLQRIQGLLFG